MDSSRTRTLITRRDTARLAREVAAIIEPGDLLILDGELGAGKTFFTRRLAHAWGLPPSESVTSPTFNLVQEYETPRGLFVHADFYRLLEDGLDLEREVANLGLREIRARKAFVVVEWGATAELYLGGNALRIHFTLPHPAERTATLVGERFDSLLIKKNVV